MIPEDRTGELDIPDLTIRITNVSHEPCAMGGFGMIRTGILDGRQVQYSFHLVFYRP